MLELNYVKFGHDLARQRVLLHLSFWIAVIVFFNFVFRNDRHPLRTLYDTLEFLPGHLLFVYSLIYVLIPHFILKGKIVASVGVLLAIVAASLFCLRLSDVYLTHYSGSGSLWMPRGFPRSIFALFSVGWIAASIKLVKYWYQEKEIQQRLEKEKLTVELQLLKSQLHPHFLFNTAHR